MKLLRKGILTRIYAPMAIVQGLREYGVFSSAIASAQTLSKNKFLSSIDHLQGRNSSEVPKTRASGSLSLPSKNIKISTLRESQAASRKVLEITEVSQAAAAISPFSPPGLDDIHMSI